MIEVEIHARYTTSDYDDGQGPGTLFDSDAYDGAIKATKFVLQYLNYLAYENKYLGKYNVFKDQAVLKKVEPAMMRIARNFWRDLDYDDRMKSAQIKEEAGKLIKALSKVVAALDKRPPYVRGALNAEARRLRPSRSQNANDVFESALNANSDLLKACDFFLSQERQDPGEAVRYRNICYDLAQLWEDMLGRKFPKTTKYDEGQTREMEGVKVIFQSPAAQFAYIAIFQIERGWVKPSQVEAGIKALPKGKRRSRPTG